ncbi:MAG: DUF748 domain-containing protein [Thermodesulfobacteriota bacterium]
MNHEQDGPSPSQMQGMHSRHGQNDKRERDPGQRKLPAKPMSGTSKLILFTTLFFFCYTLAGFVLIPLLIKNTLTTQLEARLGRPATIGSARFNPFSLHLTIKNGIIGADTKLADDPVDPLLAIGRLDLRLQPLGLLSSRSIIRNLSGNTIFLHVNRPTSGEINILESYKQWSGSKAASPPGQALITSLLSTDVAISNSRLTFSDQLTATTHELEEVNLLYNGYRRGAGRAIAPRFSAMVNGSPMELGGSTGQGQPGRGLHLAFRDISLPQYLAYIPGNPLANLANGRADIDLKVAISLEDSGSPLTISGSGVARDLWLSGKESKENKVSSATFKFRYEPAQATLIFDQLSLQQPELQLRHTQEEGWYLPALTASPKATKIEVESLMVNNGKLSVIDQKVKGGFAATFSRLNLTVDKSDNKKERAYAFNCITSRGTHIASQGTLRVHPRLSMDGLVVINNLPLAALNSYFQNEQHIDCTAGIIKKIEGQAHISVKPDRSIRARAEKIHGEISNLRLNQDGHKLIQIAMLKCANGSFESGQPPHLGDITLSGAELNLSPATMAVIFKSTAGQPAPRWTNFQQLQLQNTNIRLDNFPVQPRDRYTLTIVKGEAKQNNKVYDLQAQISLPDHADLSATGQVTTAPWDGTIDLAMNNYPASQLLQGPSQALFPTATINKARLHGKGTVDLSAKSFQGAIALSAVQGKTDRLTFSIPRLESKESQISLSPLTIALGQTRLDSPNFRLQLQPQADPSKAEKTESAQGGAAIKVAEVEVSDGQGEIIDQGLAPPLAIKVSELQATLTGLTTDSNQQMAIDLQGRLNSQGTTKVTGSLSPFAKPLPASLKIEISDFPLAPISGYLLPILQQEILGGTITSQIDYQQEENRVKAKNLMQLSGITIDQTEPKGELATAIALTSDQEGLINLEFNLNGALAEPSYSYRGALAKELRKKLLKAKIAPFSLLSSGHEANDPPADHLIFAPGSDAITADETTLKELAATLKERPLLLLTLHGFADGDSDRAALGQIKKQRLQEQQQQQQGAPQAAQTHSQEEIARLPPPVPAELTMVKKNELLALAQQRCLTTKAILIELHGVGEEQLAVASHQTIIAQKNSGRSGTRVDFSLSHLSPSAGP